MPPSLPLSLFFSLMRVCLGRIGLELLPMIRLKLQLKSRNIFLALFLFIPRSLSSLTHALSLSCSLSSLSSSLFFSLHSVSVDLCALKKSYPVFFCIFLCLSAHVKCFKSTLHKKEILSLSEKLSMAQRPVTD